MDGCLRWGCLVYLCLQLAGCALFPGIAIAGALNIHGRGQEPIAIAVLLLGFLLPAWYVTRWLIRQNAKSLNLDR